jgi:hypothetical protein
MSGWPWRIFLRTATAWAALPGRIHNGFPHPREHRAIPLRIGARMARGTNCLADNRPRPARLVLWEAAAAWAWAAWGWLGDLSHSHLV